ncbi:RNA polymerase, sigma-24 subunit, ECF subfamily [Amycolatopsis methanolica 239]|uniref:RNA polymerase, sigma-24 subunit, ECF subfamily n=2 Tax=Amycolatopsis methanolica group TaxID=2893674 RepID=A0A076MRL1_AMYME|nr:RNA polymerase, sigma-24 subunit, ECF subfamily [Amycolatopsis methanolica 239]ROS40742.1 RNA polymerase sigma factor (sigma-70 family) [Amycolatopsis thermoflava]
MGANAVTEARTAEADPSWEGLRGPELFEACLAAARAGDKRALNRLVAELTPLVWNVARGQGLDSHSAEDVVQTVWLALVSHLDRLREPKALAGWLVVTARHESQRVRGRKPPPVPLTDELAETVASTEPAPEAEVLRTERDQRLWRAFRRLPQRCQELLRLTVLAGRAEYRLVAEALQMPRGSIGPNRGRCLKTMRELLDIEGGSA